MKIELESTRDVVEIYAPRARIWEGKTVSGVPIRAYIVLIRVGADADHTEFNQDLKELDVVMMGNEGVGRS